jgi:hypothetical protein
LCSRPPKGEGTHQMSQLSRGIFGAAAIALTLGVVPLAAGRDLAGEAKTFLGMAPTGINRQAKADRPAGVARSGLPTRTISLKVNGLVDTSVLVRVPVAQAGGNSSPAPSLIKSGIPKQAVACEPVVSVLTDVAKLLQPGRCVT